MDIQSLLVQAVCGLLLCAVIGATIYSDKFRNDLLGGDNETTIMGLITVKGFAVLSLSALLLGGMLLPLRDRPLPVVSKLNEKIRELKQQISSLKEKESGLLDIVEIKNTEIKSLSKQIAAMSIVSDACDRDGAKGLGYQPSCVITSYGGSSGQECEGQSGHIIRLQNICEYPMLVTVFERKNAGNIIKLSEFLTRGEELIRTTCDVNGQWTWAAIPEGCQVSPPHAEFSPDGSSRLKF